MLEINSEAFILSEYARSLYDPMDDYLSEKAEDERHEPDAADDPRMYPGEENEPWYEDDSQC